VAETKGVLIGHPGLLAIGKSNASQAVSEKLSEIKKWKQLCYVTRPRRVRRK